MVLDLDELRNLTMNNANLMREILDALLADACRHAALLETAALQRDLGAASKFARSASRACANVGAYAAAEAFREGERHAARRTTHGWRPILDGVRAAIERLRVESQRV